MDNHLLKLKRDNRDNKRDTQQFLKK